LARKRPVARNHPRKLAQEVVDKILHLRQTYRLGPERITWYLERYHGIKTSESSVCRTLVRNGMRRLPKSAPVELFTLDGMPKKSLAITFRLMSNLFL
jgi:hypothetical protein